MLLVEKVSVDRVTSQPYIHKYTRYYKTNTNVGPPSLSSLFFADHSSVRTTRFTLPSKSDIERIPLSVE